MATTRKPVTLRHYGIQGYGNDIPYHDEEVWLDVHTVEPIPAGTPSFANIADDETVKKAVGRFQHLVSNLPLVKLELDDARDRHNSSLNGYASGTIKMEAVENAKLALSRAESVYDATKRALIPAQQTAMLARRKAVMQSLEMFYAAIEPLVVERKTLLNRLAELDSYYHDTCLSLQQTDNPTAPFISSDHLGSESGLMVSNAYERAINTYVCNGLDMPSESAQIESLPKPDSLQKWGKNP